MLEEGARGHLGGAWAGSWRGGGRDAVVAVPWAPRKLASLPVLFGPSDENPL